MKPGHSPSGCAVRAVAPTRRRTDCRGCRPDRTNHPGRARRRACTTGGSMTGPACSATAPAVLLRRPRTRPAGDGSNACAWLGIDEAPADAFTPRSRHRPGSSASPASEAALRSIGPRPSQAAHAHQRTIRRAYFLVNFQKGGGGIAPATRERPRRLLSTDPRACARRTSPGRARSRSPTGSRRPDVRPTGCAAGLAARRSRGPSRVSSGLFFRSWMLPVRIALIDQRARRGVIVCRRSRGRRPWRPWR